MSKYRLKIIMRNGQILRSYATFNEADRLLFARALEFGGTGAQINFTTAFKRSVIYLRPVDIAEIHLIRRWL